MSNLSHREPEMFDSEEEAYLQELRADDEKLAADREYELWYERMGDSMDEVEGR